MKSIPLTWLTLLCCTTLAMPKDESQPGTEVFDFHTVRGRQSTIEASGRFEGEHLDMPANARPQTLSHYGPLWSGDAHLLWDGGIGESITASIKLEEGGIFDVTMQLTAAPDYGLFELSFNDERFPNSVDLYDTKVTIAKPVTFRNLQLDAGRQRLSMKLIGCNPKAVPFRETHYLLGLDYIQLTRKDKPARLAKQQIKEGSEPVVAGQRFSEAEIKKAMSQFCIRCHSNNKLEGDVDLATWTNRATSLEQTELTRRIRNVVRQHQMPPQDEPQPPTDVRAGIVATMDGLVDDYLVQHPVDIPVIMRRMNRFEYNNAVRDLLQLKGDIYPLPEKTIRAAQPYFDPASGHFPESIHVGNRTLGKNQVERQILTGVSPFAIDLQAEGGFNNRGRELSVSPILLESFLTLGRSIVDSPEFDSYCGISAQFFNVDDGSDSNAEHRLVRSRLKQFMERAFRQPVDTKVLDRYTGYFNRQRASGKSFSASMKGVVAAVLASPKFIYIVEADSEHPSKFSSWELATRLSFFLWSTIPDDELLTTARDGSLLQPDVLDSQVRRMLESPKSQALSHNFARQWLRLDQLITAVPDFSRYEMYYSRIGCEQWKFGLQTMIEPLLLFESIMVEDRSVLLLIDSQYAWRSDELQSWYEDSVPFAGRENRNRFNTNQQTYRRRKLNDRRYGGVITSAATLTMTSAPLRTSPIVRGAWVATVIFNQPPPPPPDDVPAIEADEKVIEAKGLTLRQRLEQHQVNSSCVSCHAKIDPLGFALENFDAVGRWRDKYGSGLEIDATGQLAGVHEFRDIVELKQTLLKNPEWFIKAFTEHLLSYALARELELEDEPIIEKIVATATADHGQFTTIVREIVRSQPFRRHAKIVTAAKDRKQTP